MSDDRSSIDPELSELFRVEVERRASTLLRAPEDPRAAQRSLHALRGAAAMMGASTLASRLTALEAALREDPHTHAPLLAEALGSALCAAGILTSLSDERGADSTRPAMIPSLVEPSGAARSTHERAASGGHTDAPPGARRASYEPAASRVAVERGSAEPRSTSSSPPRTRSSVEPDVRAFFVSEAYSRLELFTTAIARARDASSEAERVDALRDAFRHAHSIKGSGSTVGFHEIALAAHAIESALTRLLAAPDATAAASAALGEAATLLAAALAVPDDADQCALDIQKVLEEAGFTLETTAPRPLMRSTQNSVRASDEVRVPSTALLALGERLTDISSVGERVAGASARSIEFGRALSDLSGSLDEAIRRLGPPRPWGVAAEVLERFHSVSRFLRDAASALESEGVGISREADALSSITTEARDDLQQLSVAPARWLFDRVVTVANAAARTTGKELRVVREGETLELPRTVAERLVEPLAQLVRNAVVHGIEAPARRLARHKSVRGLLKLTATRKGDTLVITVEDDGAGVDIDAVRALGRASAMLGPDASDAEVLALLFVPGFSTRSRVDTAAGRGVGLDLVRREAIDLGGEARVESKHGHGTRFTIEVPIRAGTRGVLVVSSGSLRVALAIDRVRRVRMREPHERVPSLTSWIGVEESSNEQRNVVDLDDGVRSLSLGVDWVEHAKDVVVRSLPTLCAGVGAWTGAIIEPEGGVLLVADPLRVERAFSSA